MGQFGRGILDQIQGMKESALPSVSIDKGAAEFGRKYSFEIGNLGTSLWSPAITITIDDKNDDDKFTLGKDQITAEDGKLLNLNSSEVKEVLKSLGIANPSQLKSLANTASYLRQLRHIETEVKTGHHAADKDFLPMLKRTAAAAGIPFGEAEEGKMKSMLEDANQAGLKSISERMREAVDRNDYADMWRQANKMKDFADEAGISPDPLREEIMNDAKEAALSRAEENALRGDLSATMTELYKAADCADDLHSPIDSARAWKILVPLHVSKIWDEAKKGDIPSIKDTRRDLYRQAHIFNLDPLSFQYTVEAAWKTAHKNAANNALIEAEAELAKNAPDLTRAHKLLNDAEIHSGSGVHDGRIEGLRLKASLLEVRERSIVFAQGLLNILDL
jgi:hypothetical protein